MKVAENLELVERRANRIFRGLLILSPKQWFEEGRELPRLRWRLKHEHLNSLPSDTPLKPQERASKN